MHNARIGSQTRLLTPYGREPVTAPRPSAPSSPSPFRHLPHPRLSMEQGVHPTGTDDFPLPLETGPCEAFDRNILRWLNDLLIVTTAQLARLLAMQGHAVTHESVRRRLNQLRMRRFVRSLSLASPRADGSQPGGKGLVAWLLDYNGNGVLGEWGEPFRALQYVDWMDATDFRRQIATSQQVVCILAGQPERPGHCVVRQTLRLPDDAGAEVRVRPHAVLTLEPAAGCGAQTFWVEVVRRNPGWERDLADKLIRHARALQQWRFLPHAADAMPTLILQGEDAAHMDTLHDMARQTPGLATLPVLLTHDLWLHAAPQQAWEALRRK
jgi:hypothetical protein